MKCSKCGKEIDKDVHDLDKDGQPVCHDCWIVEDEKLEKEMR